jgi:mannose-1-phosphate guanylyltransferase
MANSDPMRAIVLAGGSGTRFWPLSRRRRPKQLLELEGGRSLLQETVDRLAPLVEPADVWVCTTRVVVDEVRAQLPRVPSKQVLSEPLGRNTAAAIGWSIQEMGDSATDAIVAVLPADHRVGNPGAFRRTLSVAHQAVSSGDRVMTLGVQPTRAEVGYGYLELGDELDDGVGLRRVESFREKPDLETAERFFASGRFLWNAGIFVFRAGRLLELLARFEPEIVSGLARIAANRQDIDNLYRELPAISIDYAVMERCSDLATVPLECDWSDLGSWEALAESMPKDEKGNVERGDVMQIDSGGNLLFADEGTVAAVGVADLVVVRTADAVLVVPKNRSQEVKRLVAELESRGRSDLL